MHPMGGQREVHCEDLLKKKRGKHFARRARAHIFTTDNEDLPAQHRQVNYGKHKSPSYNCAEREKLGRFFQQFKKVGFNQSTDL